MFTKSEGGERSRWRKDIARNMLNGESGCGCGCGDCCGDDPNPSRVRAEPFGFGFLIVGRMFDGRRASRITVCRRATGVGEDADDADVVVVVVLE